MFHNISNLIKYMHNMRHKLEANFHSSLNIYIVFKVLFKQNIFNKKTYILYIKLPHIFIKECIKVT